MTYIARQDRYHAMAYRRVGRSGLQLPAISLGLWQNFGDDAPLATQRAVLRRAFDLGITHFDLANNYGPPHGSAELNFGRILREDFLHHRDELVISTKAGYDMWPGPYGEWGSRKYLLASLDQSLSRLGLDYVDIFYSHRADPDTPLAETAGALHSPSRTREIAKLMSELGTPLLIHQPSYSMFNRWIEDGLLDSLGDLGVGCIAFSPLAQGLLSDRYLTGVPTGSRASRQGSIRPETLTPKTLERIRALNAVAERRGQSLAQLALTWGLRDPRITSVLVGASSVSQLEQNVAAVGAPPLTAEELMEIEPHAEDLGINLWSASSSI
jgi:L-glyceraldehyde 3-phosphate reductase